MQTPETIELRVEEYLRGSRIDRFLLKHFRNYSTWRMQRIIGAGGVWVENQPAELLQRVYPGERVQVRLLEPPDEVLPVEPLELEVLFEDAWLLVINKPAGLICHPVGETQTGSLIHAVQQHLDRQTETPGILRAGIVHRLDKQTSGAILIPKHHLAHREISLQFQQSRVAKSYVALVEGELRQDEFSIDFPIGQSPGETILMSAKAGALEAKPSKTHVRVLKRYAKFTLVEAIPISGRNHQIRVHLAEYGHPVVADEYYLAHGRLRPPKPAEMIEWLGEAAPYSVDPVLGLTRHFLHAYRIGFAHPISGEWMELHAPLTADLSAALHRLRCADSL